MTETRAIKQIWKSRVTLEGAGVRLKRVFGYNEVPLLDPFLLLDYFHSDNPNDYMAGFPWHPHRGIETITYMLDGKVEHGDSLGNKGVIAAGDIQWMTAGSGIIHQEMPKMTKGVLKGFQLWANLPSHSKMMHPRYRDVANDAIPEVSINENICVKIIAGVVEGTKGPIQDIVTEPEYLDVQMTPGSSFRHKVPRGHNVFAFIFEGKCFCDEGQKTTVGTDSLVLFDDGDEVVFSTSKESVRFLLISGKPIGEPVAWYGPIVMNSQEELNLAFKEHRDGTFIKHR